jgi:hypothetical protein
MLQSIYSSYQQIAERYGSQDKEYRLILLPNQQGKISIFTPNSDNLIKDFLEWDNFEQGFEKLSAICNDYYLLTLESNNKSLNNLKLQSRYLIELTPSTNHLLQQLILNHLQKLHPVSKLIGEDSRQMQIALDKFNTITISRLRISHADYKSYSRLIPCLI